MSDLWERFKGWWCGQDLFDVALREQSRRTEETLERHRTLLKKAAEIERAKAHVELRDRFAIAVLQGMHARDSYDEGLSTPEKRARLAWIDADAMMKARGQ